MERFWGTLKSKPVHHQKYKTRTEAKTDPFEYRENFYNVIRLIQIQLWGISPSVEFESAHLCSA
jgi:hypothetical protein